MQTRHEHAEQLEELQRFAFRALADAGRPRRFTIGNTSTSSKTAISSSWMAIVSWAHDHNSLDFDFQHVNHTFSNIVQGGWLTSPAARDWLCRADTGVTHAIAVTDWGQTLARPTRSSSQRFDLKGQVTAGMICRITAPSMIGSSAPDSYQGCHRRAHQEIKPSLMQLTVTSLSRGRCSANYLNDARLRQPQHAARARQSEEASQAPHANWPSGDLRLRTPKVPDRGRVT